MVENDVRLSIDWLGLSLQMNGTPRDIPHHQWREYSATNVWGSRRILYTEDGDKVLTLLSNPRSKMIKANAALLEVENEWLYHGIGVFGILDLLRRAASYEVLGFSRLDLCADFCPDARQQDIIEGLASNKYYVGGKRNGSGFWSTNNNRWLAPQWNGRKIPHCQSWGHKTSAIKWKLYYKTKELADAGGGRFLDKPYIVDMWRCAGMDISNVWRLEVSLKHGNAFVFDGMRLDLKALETSRADIFRALLDSRFSIHKNEGHKDRTNDTQVPLLDVDPGFGQLRNATAKKLAEHNGRISLLRHLVASLEDEQVLLDGQSREAVLQHMQSIITRDGLQNYFAAMVGQRFEEYRDEVRIFASQRWAVRDALAHPLDEQKGSQPTEGRLYDIPKPQQNVDLKANQHFDETQSTNYEDWRKWFMAQLRPDSPKHNPQTNLDFGTN